MSKIFLLAVTKLNPAIKTFPFRPKGMIDGMITHLLEDGYDSVIAAKRESGWLWQESSGGNYKRLDSGDIPREFKEKSF